jgi:RNA polymerase sigma-70 factor (ECF subfamily)
MTEQEKQESAVEPSDQHYILAFQAGDRRAFDRLVLRHQNKIFNLCFRLMGEYQEADDCAQQTFVKVYRSLKGFRFEAEFATWLYTIAVNTCRNRLASAEFKARRKMVALDPAEDTGRSVGLSDLADPSPSPLAQLQQKELSSLLQNAIDDLPEEARAVVVLRDMEGLSYEEIAQVTGYNLGTVKSKLARARKALKESLQGVI